MKASTINVSRVKQNKSRIDSGFFLNDNSFLSMKIEDMNCAVELSSMIDAFNPNIFKRKMCMKNGRSLPFFQSSDVPVVSETPHLFISEQQGQEMNLIVKRGDILVTGYGSIGLTRIVSRQQDDVCYADNVCRIRVKEEALTGYIYAFLSSKYGYALLNKNASGSVVRFIKASNIKLIPIPKFPLEFQHNIDSLINHAVELREEAADELELAEKLLKEKAGLRELTPDDYDYFGQHSATRKPSCFTRKVSEFGSLSFNAFNNSERIRAIISSLPNNRLSIKDVIENGETFSSTGAPSIEVKPHCGIMLINQKDIFDTIITGKYISRRGVKTDNLVKYGEVLIASDGTLGENETFCRAIYANEDLEGAFLSSHFIRMRTNGTVPSGYLYCWLNSDYGFRLIRRTQAGTKICHPINKLFLDIPVPILSREDMNEIDRMVREAHTKRHIANKKELEAIAMVEAEIEKWN